MVMKLSLSFRSVVGFSIITIVTPILLIPTMLSWGGRGYSGLSGEEFRLLVLLPFVIMAWAYSVFQLAFSRCMVLTTNSKLVFLDRIPLKVIDIGSLVGSVDRGDVIEIRHKGGRVRLRKLKFDRSLQELHKLVNRSVS
jgi:hypothetical protein